NPASDRVHGEIADLEPVEVAGPVGVRRRIVEEILELLAQADNRQQAVQARSNLPNQAVPARVPRKVENRHAKHGEENHTPEHAERVKPNAVTCDHGKNRKPYARSKIAPATSFVALAIASGNRYVVCGIAV